MTTKPTPTPDKAQIDKFKEAAREVETDDRDEAFNAALRQVAKPVKSLGKSATKSRG